MCAAQSSFKDLTVSQEELPLDAVVKPELSPSTSTCAERETVLDICHAQEHENSSDIETDLDAHLAQEQEDSSDMLDGLTGRMVENENSSRVLIDETCGIGVDAIEPGTLSFENCASYKSASASHDTSASASLSDGALDLTGYVRKLTSPARKRKRKSICASKEFSLDVQGMNVSVEDLDRASESSSLVCIKDEVPASDDMDAECLSSYGTSVFPERRHLSKQSWQKACSLQTNRSANSSLAEDGLYAALIHSDPVCLAVLFNIFFCA